MAKHLKKSGWEYIVVDIRWYVDNDKAHGYNEKDPSFVMDEFGRFLPSLFVFLQAANGKGFKPLADYIHSKGLKFGIHIMRGIPKVAVAKNTSILVALQRHKMFIRKTRSANGWAICIQLLPGKKVHKHTTTPLFNLYASWGLDL